MAKSAATRQKDYRQRHLKDVDGTGARLNMVIDGSAKTTLERLAKCYGVTQREILQRVLEDAEAGALRRLAGREGEYYDGKASLDLPGQVTQ